MSGTCKKWLLLIFVMTILFSESLNSKNYEESPVDEAIISSIHSEIKEINTNFLKRIGYLGRSNEDGSVYYWERIPEQTLEEYIETPKCFLYFDYNHCLKKRIINLNPVLGSGYLVEYYNAEGDLMYHYFDFYDGEINYFTGNAYFMGRDVYRIDTQYYQYLPRLHGANSNPIERTDVLLNQVDLQEGFPSRTSLIAMYLTAEDLLQDFQAVETIEFSTPRFTFNVEKDNPIRVMTNQLRIRENPDNSSTVVGHLSINNSLFDYVIARDSTSPRTVMPYGSFPWHKVEFQTREPIIGYVYGAFVEGKQQSIYEAGLMEGNCSIKVFIDPSVEHALYIRRYPAYYNEVIHTLEPANSEVIYVSIEECYGYWFKISQAQDETNQILLHSEGWVKHPNLSICSQNTDSNSSLEVPLYVFPQREEIYTHIPVGVNTAIVSCHEDWVKVEYEGESGWLAPENLCANPLNNNR